MASTKSSNYRLDEITENCIILSSPTSHDLIYDVNIFVDFEKPNTIGSKSLYKMMHKGKELRKHDHVTI